MERGRVWEEARRQWIHGFETKTGTFVSRKFQVSRANWYFVEGDEWPSEEGWGGRGGIARGDGEKRGRRSTCSLRR